MLRQSSVYTIVHGQYEMISLVRKWSEYPQKLWSCANAFHIMCHFINILVKSRIFLWKSTMVDRTIYRNKNKHLIEWFYALRQIRY